MKKVAISDILEKSSLRLSSKKKCRILFQNISLVLHKTPIKLSRTNLPQTGLKSSQKPFKRSRKVQGKDLKLLPALKIPPIWRLESKKQLKTQKKIQKNSEIYSLPQQTTRDSIHAVYSQKSNSNNIQSSQNGNKQNGPLQPQIFSLPRADLNLSGISTNAELPN